MAFDYAVGVLADEVSSFSAYFDEVVQYRPLPHDSGRLLARIRATRKVRLAPDEPIPDRSRDPESRTLVLLDGNLNHDLDIQGLLSSIRPRLSRGGRVVAIAYNPYLGWVYRLMARIGLRKAAVPEVFLTTEALRSVSRLAGFEMVQLRCAGLSPFRMLGLGSLVNKLSPALPLVRWLSFGTVVLLRPVEVEARRPSLTVVVPARNEKGNIENAILRLPSFGGADVEVVFVEGHSSDGTWEEIQRVAEVHGGARRIVCLQQSGRGKNDAVKKGFEAATGELLTILDADLTTPPELLERFYDAWCRGHGDFVNGNRLVYPMEDEAMRFLNRLGNIFFAKGLSWVLDARVGDSLCGTKLFTRRDWHRFGEWRRDFGDFDPFGDFELLFPAAVLGLGIAEVPVRYLARTYGSTNIQRFRDGAQLLKMTLVGLLRLKLGRRSRISPGAGA